ncbi:hypothetical protein LINPERPRIM_LOCUS1034 [Linum perenne]
MLLLWPSS